MGTYRGLVDMELYGYAEQGDETYHEVILYGGESYEIELESEEDVALDFYITDDQDNVLYRNDDGDTEGTVSFKAGEDNLYRFYVVAVNGSTDYILSIVERE